MMYGVCAFGLFVGDKVIRKYLPAERAGFVQWIDRKQRKVSVRFDGRGNNSYIVVSPRELIKTGNRGESTLYTSKRLKEIFPDLPFEEKVFFLCSRGLTVEQVAEKANVPVEKVRVVIRQYIQRGLLP
jgi:hypothetical protein